MDDQASREIVQRILAAAKAQQQALGVEELNAERLNLFLDRGGEGLPEEDEESAPKTTKQKFIAKLRIVVPHVGLVLLSALYAILGAALFHTLESPYDIQFRRNRVDQLAELKTNMTAEIWALARRPDATEAELAQLFSNNVDEIVEFTFLLYTKNYMLPKDLTNRTYALSSKSSKWTFSASLFFSWTAITTIGYGHIVPRTVPGRIVCLVYALVGIPLVLVTIADMGRFLSAGIIWMDVRIGRSWAALKRCVRKCASCCRSCFQCVRQIGKRKPSIPLRGTNVAPQIGAHTSTTSFGRRIKKLTSRGKEKGPHTASGKRAQNHRDGSPEGTFEDISEIASTHSSGGDLQQGADDLQEDDDMPGMHEEKRVSVLFVLLIMIGFIAGGAFMLRMWEKWTFFDAFYFCFVTVTTIGFGDIVPTNESYILLTLLYIICGLTITTMCIDLVGSAYIRDIHFYGRTLGKSFMTFGGKVVHLGEVFGYVAYLQKNYGITPEQLEKLANLPDNYLLECLIQGKQPDLTLLNMKPFVPFDIYYFKWIEQPRTMSFVSEKMLASMESLDAVNTNMSRATSARTMTPREYYQHILTKYCNDGGGSVNGLPLGLMPNLDTNNPPGLPPLNMGDQVGPSGPSSNVRPGSSQQVTGNTPASNRRLKNKKSVVTAHLHPPITVNLSDTSL